VQSYKKLFATDKVRKMVSGEQAILMAKMVHEVREIFVRYMVGIFRDYESCLQPDHPECSITNVSAGFDKEKFYKIQGKVNRTFFEGFFGSRAWTTFLEEKLYTETEAAAFQI
jgi:hypothetical protein